MARLFITSEVFSFADQCLTYFICYEYAVINGRIKVATGNLITDTIADTKESFYQSLIDSDELLKDENVRDYLRKGLSEQNPMAQIMMRVFISNNELEWT